MLFEVHSASEHQAVPEIVFGETVLGPAESYFTEEPRESWEGLGPYPLYTNAFGEPVLCAHHLAVRQLDAGVHNAHLRRVLYRLSSLSRRARALAVTLS